jgi:outer membrane protein insertion porin family
MKRLPAILTILIGISIFSSSYAQEAAPRKFMIFPFKVLSKDSAPSFSSDFAAILGSELARDGDLEVVSGKPFVSAVQDNRVDTERLARIGQRAGSNGVVWGSISKLDDGYSIEISVMKLEPRSKPKLFSATGKDMEELLQRVKDMVAEIGSSVLNRPKIGSIKIEGNKRIQKDAILNKLEMKAGTPFRRSAISGEIREIYSMGYFDDVQISAEDIGNGDVDLRIVLKERPSIKNIEVQGNKVFSKDEMLDALTTKSFSVASLEKIRNDIDKIRQMYEKSGYYQPKIDYEIKELSQNEATLIFKIDEGRKSYLTEIILDGRKNIPEKELKNILNVKQKSWFWFVDESGTFTRDKLEENRMRLMAYYMDNGFINVQVGAPEVEIDGGSVKVRYSIREGERYQVRNIDVEGDLLVPKKKLISNLQTKPKSWFKRSLIAEDIKGLTKLYNNMGFAYADVEPRQKINDEHNFLDLTYKINKGERVTIEKVDVVGNDRTRDKVIRRALTISDGDLYSADGFEATKNNLENMDYFEAVRLKTSPGSKPDLMNLTVEVMEKKTGSLAAGLGYSSQDGAMGNINLKERNLFGLGIVANAKVNLSGRRNDYEGSLSYPWMFDYPLSGTVRGYKAQQKETYYLRDSDGFSAHLGYPIYGLWTMSTGFSRDSSKLTGFEQMFARSIVDYYRRYGAEAQKYQNISENSISLNFGRDTRNNSVIPTGGSKLSFGSRLSGFGGDVAFSSYYSEALYYYPLFWRAVLKFRASGSLLQEVGLDPIPFDRRIVLGGIQSIRGYRQGDIGPRDRYGNIIGGDRSLFTNVECLFPILDQLKLNGVTFIDAGNSWNVSDGPFLREVKGGVGVGLRWISPMGPIRIEYGWKIRPEKGEEPGAIAFAMGQLF